MNYIYNRIIAQWSGDARNSREKDVIGSGLSVICLDWAALQNVYKLERVRSPVYLVNLSLSPSSVKAYKGAHC